MIFFLFIAYLIGSIPFGLLLTKLAGYGDIRNIGSGNIGATNVLRTGNRMLALLTLILDSMKGFVFVALFNIFAQGHFFPKTHYDWFYGFENAFALMIGFGVIIGHCFPAWLKFKGGKGVATALGTLLAAVPLTGATACLAWLASAFLFRISSLAALIAMAVAPVVTFCVYGPMSAAINLAISALVIIRHKANIQRLLKGEEPRIGKKKTA